MLTRMHATAEVIAENVTHDKCRRRDRQDSRSSRHDWIPMGYEFRSWLWVIAKYAECRPTSELTGRGDYIQPSKRSNKLRKRLSALWSNDLFLIVASSLSITFASGK